MLDTRDLLAHAGFLREHLDGAQHGYPCRVHRAITAEDLDLAYRLGDRAARPGATWRPVTPPAGLVHRALPETAVFIAESDGDLVGVLALVPDTPGLGLPGDEAFGRELNLLREMGPRAAETTHVALAPDAPALPVLGELLRAGLAQALHDGYDEVFLAVADRYERLVEEVFQFDRWDMGGHAPLPGRRFSGKRLNLTALGPRLLEADRRLGPEAFLYTFLVDSNVYREYAAPWSVLATRTFRDAGTLRQLFGDRRKVLDGCREDQREVLRRRWGDVLFDAVVTGASPDLAPV